MTTPTKRMSDFIEESNEAGYHFFSPATMEFFQTQVHGDIIAGYFITSEQDDRVWNGKRMFTIRYAESPINITTVGDFGAYETYDEAHEALMDGLF